MTQSPSQSRTECHTLLSTSHLCPYDHPSHPFASWPSITPNPIGRLVLLTPEITAAAAKEEILTGKRFALDYPVYPSGAALFGRLEAKHETIRVDKGPETLEEAQNSGRGYNPQFDDIITLNTQASTQWDYFLHYSYYGSGDFYGGLTAGDLRSERTGAIGIGAIAKAGGIQTRALLVDVPFYLAQLHLPPLDPLSFPSLYTLDLPFLHAAFKFFNLSPRVGDVLLVRTGFEDALVQDKIRLKAGENTHLVGNWAGVQASQDMAEWIWATGFVAVGSDNPTFEEWYPEPPAMCLHPILLSGMGIMIGELLRLNEVAAECQRRSRWSFFFSSNPLMIEHGVASPPNAVAIF